LPIVPVTRPRHIVKDAICLERAMQHGRHWRSIVIAGLVTLFSGGCGTAGLSGLDALLVEFRPRRAPIEEIEAHRVKFVQDRDPEAFRWLLANTLQNGMTLAEVNQALGDKGERIYDDQKLKFNRGEYLQTDVAYKWGPTSDGHSVVLVFRDGRLIQFDPKSFEAPAALNAF
jgi:hypothetical protein